MVVVVLTSDGGSGWVVMVGRCSVDGGICVLVVVHLQVLCVYVGVFVYQRKEEEDKFGLILQMEKREKKKRSQM